MSLHLLVCTFILPVSQKPIKGLGLLIPDDSESDTGQEERVHWGHGDADATISQLPREGASN